MSPTYSICADHGYLNGEQWKCPICGKETEVYSRITGYYRPVKNWNAGKVAEFKARRTYAPEETNEAHHNEAEKCSCGEEHSKLTPKVSELMLFTSPTCPNCKMAKMILDQNGIKYTCIDAIASKDVTLAYGIKKAPTLLVPEGDSFKAFENASLIKGYVESVKAAASK